jgi:hypothetical protein
MNKLSVWQKIGILFSLIWIVGSFYVQYGDSIENATKLADLDYKSCIEKNTKIIIEGVKSCDLLKQEKYDLFMGGALTNASVIAFLPLPFFWIYGVILLTFYRCLAIGRKEVIKINLLSGTKRYFVYFCYFFTALTFLICIIVAMNNYADDKVPTYLGYKSRIMQYGGSVSIEGTWTNKDLLDSNTRIVSPLQTSKIVCNREKLSCIESRAMIIVGNGKPSMSAEIFEYEVLSWTKNTIIYSEPNMCYETIFSVDLNSKSVVGVERFANNAPNKEYCKEDKSFKYGVYKLEDGIAVYEQHRKKASPYLLRLVYALFGN